MLEEYRRFSEPKERQMDQQFMELFDTSEAVEEAKRRGQGGQKEATTHRREGEGRREEEDHSDARHDSGATHCREGQRDHPSICHIPLLASVEWG